MIAALVAGNLVELVLIAALAAAVLALARQVGVLHERIAPMGALTLDRGPAAGDAAPAFALTALDGRAVAVGGGGARQLLFFLSPTCPVCKKLIPALRSIAADEGRGVEVVLASDGAAAEHAAFAAREKLAPLPYVLSAPLGLAYQIGRLPYAVLIGADGRIAATGLVNSREQIESLFTAEEMGVGSLQEMLSVRQKLEAADAG
jgi:methylamine dehydrogenase accessory protein MauD